MFVTRNRHIDLSSFYSPTDFATKARIATVIGYHMWLLAGWVQQITHKQVKHKSDITMREAM